MSACKEGYWPPQAQVIGKDILRFHAIYWPAFLMAMFREEGDDLGGELPERVRQQLPKTILTHGWWLMGETKISKSLGNIVRPKELLHFGCDAARFFLLREMQIGHDRSFTFEIFIERLNADLANGLGNLASRSISMLHKYRSGAVPEPTAWDESDNEIKELIAKTAPDYLAKMENNNFSGALECLWATLRGLDGYIVKSEPWNLAKVESGVAKLDTVVAQLYRALRMTAILAAPVMPQICQSLWESLGLAGKVEDQRFGDLEIEAPAPDPVKDAKPLFARIDKDLALDEIEALQQDSAKSYAPKLDVPDLRETTDYDTFCKTDLRIGQILEAERVPKSDKLIKMKVDIGLETRTVVGGIGKAYEPGQLIGRKVVVVANLAPRKLMGIESHGMLLCASDNASKPYLIVPSDDALPGFIVK
jgi:methionyl-tRNA synthetase